MYKTPKTRLHEVYKQLTKTQSEAKLNFETIRVGEGVFRCVYTLTRNKGVLKGTGDGKGKQQAEHAAAKEILTQMGFECDDFHSPTKSIPPGAQADCPGPSTNLLTTSGLSMKNNNAAAKKPVNAADDPNVSVLPISPDWDYVRRLKEYCKNQRFDKPQYIESGNSSDKQQLPIYMAYCTAGGVTRFGGEAQNRTTSKQLAAARVMAELGLLVDDDGKDVKASDAQVAKDSCQTRSVNIPGIDSQRLLVAPGIPGDAVKISDKVWYFPDKILGSGGFSKVFEGYKEVPTCRVAIKQVRKEDDPKNKELEILMHVKHENLIEYYFREEVNGFVYFVMELAHSALDKWIKEEPRKQETLLKICKDVARGLKELHRRNVIHRDIKPNNVLIFLEEKTGGVIPKGKLTDFGISRVIDGTLEGVHTTGGMLGTTAFKPPETKANMELKQSFDIFQLGLLFTFTVTRGDHLFAWPGQLEPEKIQAKIFNYQPNWNVIKDRNLTALKNILQVMVAQDPNKRSEISVLLEHPFFWDFNESLQFMVAVSNDIKNGGKFNTLVSSAAQKFLKDMPDWKIRLDQRITDWITRKDKAMEDSKRKGSKQIGWKKYRGTSIIHLINFIRDQQQHNLNWTGTELEAEDLFGKDGVNYGIYFVQTFPELPTLLYNVLQDPKFRGPATKKYFDKNTDNCFSLH